MRSRPEVKVYLAPAAVVPGERLIATAVLSSRTDTPVDFVELRLRGRMRLAVAGRYVDDRTIYDRVWRAGERELVAGEHRFPVEFPFGGDALPSHHGVSAWIDYSLDVHVSIPWWPDRRRSFVVPVAFPPAVPGEDPRPVVVASSPSGPRGGEPFMEVALDATDLARGDVVTGSVSLSNASGRAVRGIDLFFVEVETLLSPMQSVAEKGRFKVRLLAGAPGDGEAVPFRVRVPERATPSFAAGPVRGTTYVEVVAHVAWGSDVVVRVPISVAPARRPEGRPLGAVAPVGRERVVLAWQRVARTIGFVADAEGEGIHGMRGGVRVRIASEHTDGDVWLVAELFASSLGLDLDVGMRKWTDALAASVVDTGQPEVDGKLTVRAREPAQARAFVRAFVPALAPFEDVLGDDAKTVLATRGSVHAGDRIGAFVRAVLRAADALDAARGLIGPPAAVAGQREAWGELADALHGRLELGRMWITGGRVGTDAVEVGCAWSPRGLLLGAIVRVAVDPPLGDVPRAPDDPSLPPAAREAWTALAGRAKDVHLEPAAISVELPPLREISREAMPIVDLAVSLRRALTGASSAGPFR